MKDTIKNNLRKIYKLMSGKNKGIVYVKNRKVVK